jgi:vancomycin resistance protein YoaR
MIMKNRTLATGLAAMALAVGLTLAFPAPSRADTLPEGLYVGEYSLGGMTEEEASEKIQSLVGEMENQKITLVVDGESVDTTAKELGFHWSNTDAVNQAAASVTGGNLIHRYLNLKDIEHNHVVIPLETAFDDGKVAAFVEEKCASVVAEPKDASITRENGAFVVTPAVVGKSVDAGATKAALDEAISGGLKEPVTVTAAVTEAQPNITTEALSTIQDVLGTFSTDFSSSGNSRATNLRVGAGKINGHVLMPGETLSGYECMHPFTTANGYATAAAYENGQVVDSVGGGVCQISTTLYNASLRAELEITQRQNHSMIVTYVKPSEDAAIAGTYKDLKITNNYSTPIYVEGYTSGKTLTFTIYGKETRPANRTFKFVSETLGTMDPGPPKEEVDPTMEPGARKQVQSAHRGYKSRLWKYVYIDGVEQSKEILHTDTYNASKAIVKVGPAAPAVTVPLPEETTAPVETTPVEPTPVEGVDGGPGVTEPTPETAAPAPVSTPDPVPAPQPGGSDETPVQ